MSVVSCMLSYLHGLSHTCSVQALTVSLIFALSAPFEFLIYYIFTAILVLQLSRFVSVFPLFHSLYFCVFNLFTSNSSYLPSLHALSFWSPPPPPPFHPTLLSFPPAQTSASPPLFSCLRPPLHLTQSVYFRPFFLRCCGCYCRRWF